MSAKEVISDEEFLAKLKILIDDTPETVEDRIDFLFKVNAKMVADIHGIRARYYGLERRVHLILGALIIGTVSAVLKIVGF